MTRYIRFVDYLTAVFFLAALLASLPAAAQDSEFDRCRDLESDAERLACYDAVSKEGTDVAEGVDNAPTGGTDEAATAGTAAAAIAEPEKKEKKKKRPRQYTAVVTKMDSRPHGQVVVTLDNGEVWSEQYASRAFLVKVGDTIELKKSRFSSGYRLVAPGGRGYEVTRLR